MLLPHFKKIFLFEILKLTVKNTGLQLEGRSSADKNQHCSFYHSISILTLQLSKCLNHDDGGSAKYFA